MNQPLYERRPFVMSRRQYYSTGPKNLGLPSFLKFEYRKRATHSQPFHLTSKFLDHPVLARPNSSDLEVFSQILFFREYRCLDGIKSPKLIFDLGANVGYSAAYFLSRFKDCKVVAVEPDPANFGLLQTNLAPYENRAIAIQAAVWPNSDQKLELSFDGPGHEWALQVKPSQTGSVRAVTIPELLRISGGDKISVLKIDIEGAETELFSSNTNWLKLAENIVIEIHNQDAHDAFYSKIDPTQFEISTCDELTVCLKSGRT